MAVDTTIFTNFIEDCGANPTEIAISSSEWSIFSMASVDTDQSSNAYS